MFNWNTSHLIPKLLKNILPDNIYKPKYLKDFIIVSMLRNYVVKRKNLTQENSLIVNKYLINKAIGTSKLTVKTTKTYKSQSYAYEYNCEIYKVVVHINNNFNPTNISLFSSETQIHLYQLEGDQTLHINLNLKTLFKFLTNEADLVEIKKSSKDYTLSNSKLSWFVSKLLTTLPIFYYVKDSDNNWVEEGTYAINESEPTFGSGYYYSENSETFLKFELGDILIFYHNLWWSSILMMFYLYNIPVWRGNLDPDKNTNRFRLKASILQLLGGFSKVNMLEKVKKSITNHYTIDETNFNLTLEFKEQLMQLETSVNQNPDYFFTTINNLFLKTNNNLHFTNDLIASLTQFVFDSQLDLEANNYDSEFKFSSNEISQLKQKKVKFNLTTNDHLNLNYSFKEFKVNYQFNILLLYLLNLELIIKIIYGKIKSITESKQYNKEYLSTLENILVVAIINYFKIVNEYNSIIEAPILQLEVPDNFPNPFIRHSANCYCDHINQNTSSFTLLLSEYKIQYNLYSTSALKTFCGNICSNPNSIFKSKSNSPLTNQLNKNNFSNPKRELSTSSRSRINLENNNNNLLTDMQDNSNELSNKRKNKNVNYNKSIFSLLEKINELTTNKNYKPQEVQLKIENFWSEILKEKYNDNIYNSIKDIQPRIYEIFVTKDPYALKLVFPYLYLFLDDIKIYLTTYSVMTTYFRRASRTAICSLVGDQILFFIYQTYFYPIIKDSNKGIKIIKIKSTKSKKDYDKVDIFNSLTKNKKDKLLKLIEVSKFRKENFSENSKINKTDIEGLISNVIFILEKILLRKGLKSFQEIKSKDFVEQICFYFYPSYGNLENLNLNMELNKDLEISVFKIKLGERFVYAFEDANIIKNLWRNGMRSIDIFNSNQNPNNGPLTLEFNENIIQENIDKLTNILPTNLPMICQPNKWSNTEYGGYLNN